LGFYVLMVVYDGNPHFSSTLSRIYEVIDTVKTIPINCKGNRSIPFNKLRAFQGNLKEMSKESAGKLRASILKHGWVTPIFVWGEDYILDGHGRLLVLGELLKEGYAISDLPVCDIEAATKKEAAQILLAINSKYQTITDEGLYEFMAAMELDMGDLTEIDLPDIDLAEFEAGYFKEEKIEGEIAEVPLTPRTKLGDLYTLGKHRLLCGDSTKKDDVERLMEGKKADMVFTDPPYAVNYGADQDILNKKSGGKFRKKCRLIKGDNLSVQECAKQIWRPAFHNYYDVAADDCSFYMTMCQDGDQMMMMMMMSEKWQVKHELIWVKNAPVFSMGRLNYDYKHEPILFGWKKKHNWYGKGQFLNSVWEIPKPHKSDLHPTMKPIELVENALLNSSLKGNLVIDFFLGSGSTLIAAEKTDRICYGIELDPAYCDVVVSRYLAFIKGNGEVILNGKKIKWEYPSENT